MERMQDPFRLEEKLEHKLAQAEYIIPLVIGLMLYVAGFVDLLTNTTPGGAVLGVYSLPLFAVLLVYAAGFGGWWWLIVPRDSVDVVKRGIAYVQRRAWLGLLLSAAGGAVIFSILEWYFWLYYPLLGTAVLLLIVLALGLLLLARPEPQVKMQAWRRVLLALAGAAIAVEVITQMAAAVGLLPVRNLSGLFVPHGRIYQRTEAGVINASTNRYGWYYPEFSLRAERRIILAGGAYLQGLRVRPRENMGVRLERLIDRSDTEVLALGYPEYGPGIYADTTLHPYTAGRLEPDEMVVVFHLANDLQAMSGPERYGLPYYVIDGANQVDIHPDSVDRRHELWHVTITGYDPMNPVLTLQSQLFTLQWLDQAWRGVRGQEPAVPELSVNTAAASDAQPFGASSFAFEREGNPQAENAFTIATRLLEVYHAALKEQGVSLRLVTIPYFPAAFYRQNSGAAWSTELGPYDILLPEKRLAEFARSQGIPFLPMGAYLRAAGLSVDDIRSLFYEGGTGHFTPAGHALYAEAMYVCFYSDGACPLK